MGVIRKTASIGTLGLVNFRSKKEKLARAEAGLSKLERKLARLSNNEAKATKELARLKRHRKVRKAETLTRLISERATDVRTESAKRGRRAAKAARKATKELRTSAEHAVESARNAVGA